MKDKKKLLPISVVILLSGFICYFFYGTPWDLFSYKNDFAKYLETKYDNEFVIKDISFDFFHNGIYHAYAHIMDQPGFTFYVGQNPYTKRIEDSYVSEIWQKQAKEELGPIVEKFFPDKINYSVETIVETNLFNDYEPPIPNYKKHVTADVGISMNEFDITNENRNNELDRAYLLLKDLEEKGIKFNLFSISYKNKVILIQPNDIVTINSREDLEKYLIDYK
ncbi:MAG TPA: hypothetical protein VEV44_01750 [Pseudoneobacillus sp.]|nr:hypothetical protein [Pseudoneobacillus sp.]